MDRTLVSTWDSQDRNNNWLPYFRYYKTVLYLFLRPFGHSSRPSRRFFLVSLELLVRLLFKGVLYSRASYNSGNTVVFRAFEWGTNYSCSPNFKYSCFPYEHGSIFLNSITTQGTKYFKWSIYCSLLKIYLPYFRYYKTPSNIRRSWIEDAPKGVFVMVFKRFF